MTGFGIGEAAAAAQIGVFTWKGWKTLRKRFSPIQVLASTPFQISREVLGRDEELAELHELLKKHARAEITSKAVVKGEGGRGKTTLALEYIRVHGGDYDAVWWVNAADEESTLDSIFALGEAAGMVAEGAVRKAATARQILQKICDSEKRWLFVYDNVDHPKDITKLIIQGVSISVLVTSRVSAGWPDFLPLDLDVLPTKTFEDPGVQLLVKEARLQPVDAVEKALAVTIAQELGGLPHAIIMAAALCAFDGLSLEDLAARLDEVIFFEDPTWDYSASVFKAVMASYAALSDDAKLVVDTCAWFAPEGIAEALFLEPPQSPTWALRADEISTDLKALVENTTALRTALRNARQRSMLGGDDLYTMHRTTSAALRAHQAKETHDFKAARGAAFLLAELFPIKASFSENWPACRALEPHSRSLWAQAAEFWEGAWKSPGWESMDFLLNQMSIFQSRQGRVVDSVDTARASLTLTQARLGKEHRDVAVAYGNLANELVKTGEVEAAREMIAKAVALDAEQREGSVYHGSRLYQQALIALRAFDQSGGEAEKADFLTEMESALKAARPIREKNHGVESREMAPWWNLQAQLHLLKEEFAPMLEARGQSYVIVAKFATQDGDSIASSAMNLGSDLLELGHAEAGLRFLQEALDKSRAIFEAKHPDIRNAAGWLERCHRVLARAGKAQEKHHEASKELCEEFAFDEDERAAIAAGYPTKPQIDLPQNVKDLL
ncbi:MAG: tetratricopeptide repeat protein [Pseudomonadota bacterium]